MSLKEYSKIEVYVSQTGDPYNPEKYSYNWIGDSDECVISYELLTRMGYVERDMLKNISIGQFELSFVGYDNYPFGLVYTRTDKRFAFLKLLRYRLTEWLKLINHRILRTLIIWNLMETPLGAIPSWKDLKVFK